MRLGSIFLTAAAFMFAVAPIAKADSLQLTVNSTTTASFTSPDSSWWGIYSTLNSPYRGFASIGLGAALADFSNISLFVPYGNAITSAKISVIVPTTQIEGTGNIRVAQGLAPPYSGPSSQPSFGAGTSEISAWLVYELSSPLTPIINGNEVSTGDLSLFFNLTGTIFAPVSDPGYNWTGYTGGNGQADIPYTVQLDVSYSPVPEPSSIALLSTGLVGFAGFARRKYLS